jgi:KipI family sensor histidine kinase inhibitor
MTAHPRPRFLPCGDAALTIELGDGIDPLVNARVLALDAALAQEAPAGIIETVPTYRSILVHLDPLVADVEVLAARVETLLGELSVQIAAGRRWRVPVVYGGEFGLDLDDVAERHGLTRNELIDRHAAPVYRVYMIGFMPGFSYLGGLDPTIATPRRLDPRPMTPAQTISIGGIQALVAGQAMPSGWHLLGRTPVRTFHPGRDPVFLLAPGDEVVFEPTPADRWDALDRRSAAGEPVAEVIGETEAPAGASCGR